MNSIAIILIIAAAVLPAAAIALTYPKPPFRRRTRPYDPGNPPASRDYRMEPHSHDTIHIRSLTRDDAERFAGRWQEVEREFVEDPEQSVGEAGALIREVMRLRGYPPEAAYAAPYGSGSAGAEGLRQGMQRYRDRFDELLEGHLTGEKRSKHI